MLSSILSYTAASLNCPSANQMEGSDQEFPLTSGKTKKKIRHIILSVFFFWDIDFACLSLPQSQGISSFLCRGGRVGAVRPDPEEVTAPSMGQWAAAQGAPPASSSSSSAWFYVFFSCLNEAALPSACLPSGAERIRVQSHQRASASAYELFVLPLLSVS